MRPISYLHLSLVLGPLVACSASPDVPEGLSINPSTPGGPSNPNNPGGVTPPGGGNPNNPPPVDIIEQPPSSGAPTSGEAPAGCGDGTLSEEEACDDGNTESGDGCASDCRSVEPGFSCAAAGKACLPIAVCGDGVVAPSEQCDDGNNVNGDGCSDRCRFEFGMKCSGEPSVCEPTVCGDGIVEGAESCDDGNTVPFDGCSERCVTEPKCDGPGGACSSECGDGLVIGEECDDGNRIDGDGCSSNCEIEDGFTCELIPPPCEQVGGQCVFRVPVVYRDHSGSHPDFGPNANECMVQVEETGELVPANALTTGLVQPQLDAEGRPQLVGTQGTQRCETGADKASYVGITQFDDWFRDGSHVVTVADSLVLFDNGAGGYVNRFDSMTGERFEGYEDEEYDSEGDLTCSWCLDGSCEDPCSGTPVMFDGSPLFFPLDHITGPTADLGKAKVPAEYGYTAWPWEEDVFNSSATHNFYFTSEVRTWFQYDSSTAAVLEFTGDDDVWVFVNGRLAVDLGGIHVPEDGSVTINAQTATQFGLEEGKVYSIAVFQAERRMEGSSFRLTLSGFESTPSECSAECGDGIVSFGEECDDGVNDGGYGECAPGCKLGEYCGDGIVSGPEQCEPGVTAGNCVNCRLIQVL